MSGGFALALSASFAWGILSVLLSPCHLSSIPLIVGYLTMRGEQKVSRGFIISILFAVGILVTIGVIGVITGALGRIMGDIGPIGNYVVAAIFIGIGLYLMDLFHLPDIGIAIRPTQLRSPFLSALILGLVFGVALGPCTYAFMAPVLGLVFQLSDKNPAGAGALLLSFGLGHAGVIGIAGGITSRVQAYLSWTGRSKAIVWVRRSTGFLVALGGLYFIYAS